MALCCEKTEEQIKMLSKKIEANVDIDESFSKLLALNAPLKLYKKFNVKKLTRRFASHETFGDNARLLKQFLGYLKKVEKTAKKQQTINAENRQENEPQIVTETEEVVEKNRKRRCTSPVNIEPKRLCLSDLADKQLEEQGYYGYGRTEEEKQAFKLETIKLTQHFLMQDIIAEQAKNTSRLSERTLENQFLSGQENGKQILSLFNISFKYLLQNPRLIQRFCMSAPFELLKQIFHQCNYEEKILFARFNSNYLEQTETLFQDLCMKEFQRNNLPKNYSHWCSYYESLSEEKAKMVDEQKTASIKNGHTSNENTCPEYKRKVDAPVPCIVSTVNKAPSTNAAPQASSTQPKKKRMAPMMTHCLRMAKKQQRMFR